MQKSELYEILVKLGIDEGVRKNAPNDEMIALILANAPVAPTETGTDDEDNEPPADDLPKFTPEQLIKSSTYSHRRDVLRVMLNDDKTYSHAQIAWMMKRFYERREGVN